jgi:hypothetical protein
MPFLLIFLTTRRNNKYKDDFYIFPQVDEKGGENVMRIDNTYAYTSANTAATAAAATTAGQNKEVVDAVTKDGASKANTDRVELSNDTKVTKKMSDAERAELVKSLKADLDNQTTRFTNMMMQMFQKQGITGLKAGSDSFWRQIASGNFTVDAKTKAEAQEAISEDGYWGVKQTSQRIFDFAKALAGDDVEQMKKMQAAVEKGFGQAKSAWGGELPSISGETYNAVSDLFDEYYAQAGDK